MEYELYWTKNKNEDMDRMVIGGSFGTIADARAYSYKAIGKSPKCDLSKKDSLVITIIGIDRDGYFFDYGKVGKLNGSIVYGNKGKYYRLSKDGSITIVLKK